MGISLKKKLKKIKRKLIKKNELNVKAPFEGVGNNWKNSAELPVAFMFGFNPWKREHMSNFFSEYKTVYVFGSATIHRLEAFFNKYEEKVFIVWGFKEPEGLAEYAEKNNIKLYRVEDGFVRSVGLGAAHSLPLSIAADSRTLYFDSRTSSDLEVLLETYDFTDKEELLNKSQKCMNMLIDMGVSKYNHTNKKDIKDIYGEKTKKRILVVGQVEDDASIRYGCAKTMNNNDLVWAAYNENPDAEIIYKPHPDVLEGYRKAYSNPMDVAHISKVVIEPLGLVDALETIDHVYTITSLSGFEALIRGIKVTCFGAPFYSGWGLTDDRQQTNRRNRKLSIDELFAISYMVYPRYIDIESGNHIDLEKAIYILNNMIGNNLLTNAIGLEKNNYLLEAESTLTEAYKRVTDSKLSNAINLQLLRLYNKQKNYMRTIEAVNQLISSNNFSSVYKSELIYEKANALESLGEYVEALTYYKESISLNKTKEKLNKLVDFLWNIEGPSNKVLSYVREILNTYEKINVDEKLKYASIFNNYGQTSVAINLLREEKNINNKGKILVEKVPYLSLAANIEETQSELDHVSDVNKIYKNVIKYEKKFQSLLKENLDSFCIVGNGNLEKKGEFIDKHKLVIRISEFSSTTLNPKNDGHNTNIWVSNYNNSENLEDIVFLNGLDLVYYFDSNIDHRFIHTIDQYRYFFNRDIAVQSYNGQYLRELIAKLEKKPSNCLMLLYLIYRQTGPISQKSLVEFNMDYFSSEEKVVLEEIISTN